MPRGFGLRVTAEGIRAFLLDYPIRRRQSRSTIATSPTGRDAVNTIADAGEWRAALGSLGLPKPRGTMVLTPIGSFLGVL